jgi:multidrug resistance efflux pump
MSTSSEIRVARPHLTTVGIRTAIVGALGCLVLASVPGCGQARKPAQDRAIERQGSATVVRSEIDTTVRVVRVSDRERVAVGAVLVELDPSDASDAVRTAALRVVTADEGLSAAGVTEVAARAATLLEAKGELERARMSQPSVVVRAPVAGVVGRTFRVAGDQVAAQQPLVEILSSGSVGALARAY